MALPEGTHTLIRLALEEDIGTGDQTTLACIPAESRGAARLLVKQEGVLAGLELAEAICEVVDPGMHRRMLMQDGANVVPGDIAFTVTGPARSILIAERVLLNFMQHMSGIATLTRKYVNAVEGTGCRVLDTRKTTPGLRAIEKWAVRIGGGHNHRFGLYDMVLIKDNHIDMAGGVANAIRAVQTHLEANKISLPVEIECRNMKELEEVMLVDHVQRVMFDNFSLEDLRRAVLRVGGKYETEASGGINLDTAAAIARSGVNFISVGAITHSAPGLDLSLKAM